MRLTVLVAIGFVIVLGTSTPPVAAEDASASLDAHAKALSRAAQAPEGEQVVAAHLSKELGIPTGTLQTQRESTKLGWSELLIANRLAQRTGLSFDQIVSEFRSGKGWGRIAKEHNVNLG
jgi:hypothetical protein